jgi:hypothetical protein
MSTAVTPDGVRALLADGRVVVLRTITPADADAVLALRTRLSEHDRYRRRSSWSAPAGGPAVAALREVVGPVAVKAVAAGVLLQPMAAPGRELIIDVDSDETFGPLVLFGLGGTDTDLIADRVARLTHCPKWTSSCVP